MTKAHTLQLNPLTHADIMVVWVGRVLFLTRCAKCGAPRLAPRKAER